MTIARSPSKRWGPRPAARAIAALTAAALGLASFPARPQTGANAGIPMIRDAEIEQLMRDYTAPILRTAGLTDQNIHVVLIDDKSFNAFVMDAHRIFVNVGALAAGGRNADIGNVGMADITAPKAFGVNHLLAYQRAQEESADRAGVRFLTASGQSAKGMYDVFKRFADESMYSAQGANPYFQNHPMPQERMAALAELVKTPYWAKKDSTELQLRHDMMRAKLAGFTERPASVQSRYPSSDTSLPARYARAISTYRYGEPRSAMAQIDALLQAMPNNPYFHELKGQALLEGGHPADAIAPLRRAAQLAPNPALIQILLAQALVATNDPKSADEAISLLRGAVLKEPEAADAYTTLAMAYGRKNDLADADLASAQAAFARGDNKTARELAERAKQRFPVGSPGWVRADDIVAFNKNHKQNPLHTGP